jgi:hypothetical protein
LALRNGEEWIERNIKYIENMTIPYRLLRWDTYINSDAFAEQLDLIEKLYNSDKEYHDKININIKSFLDRYNKHTDVLQQDKYSRAYALCLDYLKEECAGMCLWINDHYNYEVYPHGRNQAMSITYKKLIKPNHPNLLKSVSIRFKKYYPKNFTIAQQNSILEV